MTSYAIPGFSVTDHRIRVPLDWAQPDGEQITVFAREIAAPGAARDLPILLFLQGGPGGKSPRPNGGPGWLSVALKRFRVLLLDQRGTGLSSPVQGRRMAAMGADEGARFLSHFLADSIVRDCEHLRQTVFGGQRWFTLGQSYGGFLTLTYLSMAPEGLAGCYVTGGLAGIHADAAQVYRHTYPRVLSKNAQYFQRFPQDRALVDRLADHLDAHDIRLLDGDRLHARRLQHLGMGLGMSGGFESLHWLLDEAFCDDGQLSDSFLATIAEETSYHQRPLYAAIHEAIYAQPGAATDWAAERLLADYPGFDASSRPLLFTGEMIYPWMFNDMAALRPFVPAVHALAQMPASQGFYDPARLAANEVPVTAAVYSNDMYVDMDLSLQTARGLGNARLWITSEYEHNGLRTSTRVLERLLAMADGLEGLNFA